MPDSESIKYRRLGAAGHYPTVSPAVVVILFFFIGIFVLLFYRRRELYLGPDHLLTVESTGYTEEYRFFNFTDIQSITIRSTAYYTTWIIVLTLVCAGLILIGAQIGDTPGWAVFGSLAGILGIALLVHVFKGPTVQCKLKTAVSEIELPSLGRLNRARSCLAEIESHIEQVQGRMETADIAQQIHLQQTSTAPLHSHPSASEPPPAPTVDADADEQDSGKTF